MLHNARNWYRAEKNAEATAKGQLQSILTQVRRTGLASAHQTLAARPDAMMIAEAEPFNDG